MHSIGQGSFSRYRYIKLRRAVRSLPPTKNLYTKATFQILRGIVFAGNVSVCPSENDTMHFSVFLLRARKNFFRLFNFLLLHYDLFHPFLTEVSHFFRFEHRMRTFLSLSPAVFPRARPFNFGGYSVQTKFSFPAPSSKKYFTIPKSIRE